MVLSTKKKKKNSDSPISKIPAEKKTRLFMRPISRSRPAGRSSIEQFSYIIVMGDLYVHMEQRVEVSSSR